MTQTCTAGQRWQGLGLVAIGLALPLGEGLVWLALSVSLVTLLCRGPHVVDWRVLRQGAQGRMLRALGLYLALGLGAIGVGGHGPLRPSEWGRQGPWLMLPVGFVCLVHTTPIWRRRAAWAFGLSLSVAALFGLICYAVDGRPGEILLRPSDLAAHQGFVPGTQRTVAGGFYFHRLKMAHVLLLGLGALAARQLCTPLSYLRRSVEGIAFAIMLTCLVFTFTRGAFLGLGAGFVAALYAAPRRVQLRAVVLGLAGLCTLGAVPEVRARLHSMGGHEAAGVRGLIWSQAVEVMADHPYGVGLGNYTPVIGAYYDRIDPGFATRTYPHNVILAAWAEAGPLGMMAYASVWLVLGQAALRALRRPKAAPASVVAFALFVTAAFWTVGMTHDLLYHNVVGQSFVAAAAWSLAMLSVPRPPARRPTEVQHTAGLPPEVPG